VADVVRLGGRLADLELTIRRRSSQAFALEVSTDVGPLQVQGAVVLQVEDTLGDPDVPIVFPGAVSGNTVTWQLDAQQSDLPFGQRWAALVLLPLDGGDPQVWARGSAWVR
jgi:hypothetical protein